jgi:hypothetical protein
MTSHTRILPWVAIASALIAHLHTSASAHRGREAPSKLSTAAHPSSRGTVERALLDKYCVTCHNDRRKTAGLLLDKEDVERVDRNPEVWEKVLRKLRTASMPPAGVPRPEQLEYQEFASFLEGELDRLARVTPNPGRPAAVHRLNRVEYTNAVRDLLALEIDGRSMLPPDDTGYGFDNIGDVLSVSPSLLERYLLAARKIANLAVGNALAGPVIDTFKVSAGFRQDDRMSEELPFGSRGGVMVHYNFPLDGNYVIKIRLQRTFLEVIRGMSETNLIDVRLDKRRIKLLTIGGKFNDPPAADKNDPEGQRSRDLLERFREQRQDYLHNGDNDLEVKFPARAGNRAVGVALVADRTAAEGILEPQPSVVSIDYAKKDFDAGIDSIQLSGPYDATAPAETPSRTRIFICQPTRLADERPCAERIVAGLARRAYRHAVRQPDLQTLLAFYESGRKRGTFETGIESALERILIDPEFLLRIEREPSNVTAGSVYRLSDGEIASRLSFFLWSSIPDDELLTLAEQRRLKDPATLTQQVLRMLKDRRSAALVTNFASQWLYVRNLRSVAPDPDAFSEFDDNLREAFQRETELFCESLLRDDRSVLDFLRANYTFVNERLARHYGIPGVYGSHFRRVVFDDNRRAGILGQGSILTVTSYPTRTSPVKRGKWLLENLLGAPPPPPPANVPALKENDEGGKPTTVRARMEEHRKNPTCAACHARMDPLGFALDNFDAIGRWRTSDAGTTIDASGALPDGTKFRGSEELRALLLKRGDEFVATFTDKLMTYALGRGTEYYDLPAVRTILRAAQVTDYSWSSIVLGIVRSTPFQMRRTAQPDPAGTRAHAQ